MQQQNIDNSGYLGRVGLFEVAVSSGGVRLFPGNNYWIACMSIEYLGGIATNDGQFQATTGSQECDEVTDRSLAIGRANSDRLVTKALHDTLFVYDARQVLLLTDFQKNRSSQPFL